MNYEEILERPSPCYISTDEAQYIVGEYIRRMTGEIIKVNIMKNFQTYNNLNPWGIFTLEKEHKDLFDTFNKIQNNYLANKK